MYILHRVCTFTDAYGSKMVSPVVSSFSRTSTTFHMKFICHRDCTKKKKKDSLHTTQLELYEHIHHVHHLLRLYSSNNDSYRHNVSWWLLPIILSQLCTCAKSTHPIVSVVDRHGQRSTICDACGLCRTIWSILRPVFADSDGVVRFTNRSDA